MKSLITFLLTLIALTSFALDGSHFTITRVTAPYFVVDGNSPATITRAFVGFKIRNNSNSGVTYSSLKFTISSITSSVTGQNYSVISPASGISNIGTLAPGQSKTCYYYVNYPANVTPQGTFNVALSDLTANSKTQSFLIKNRSAISANAGGAATQAITNQDLIGATVIDDVTYVVGNAQNGDENDFQVAVTSAFDPTKITLISTQVISSSIPGIPASTADSLYFISTGGSNGATVTIRWTFKITNFNFTTQLLPSAGSTSGNTNYKYALNTALGAGTPVTVSSTANPLKISKTSDKSVYLINSTATFTITIQNPGAYGVTLDRITDQLPAGFTFQSIDAASGVTAANSTIAPASGSVGTLTFEGGVSGANTSYYIPPGGSLVLKYTAIAPGTAASNLSSIATDYVGTTTVGTSQSTVSVATVLPVDLASFKAKDEPAGIRLEWTTAKETSSNLFEIERSNGSGFKKIAEVAARGTSLSNTDYSFLDVSAPSGLSNYRLKMIDVDHQFKYSAVTSVNRQKADRNAVSLASSNQVVDNVKLNLHLNKSQSVQIDLYDFSGKLVKQKAVVAVKGNSAASLDGLGSLQPGNYLLNVIIDHQNFSIHVVKSK